MPWPGRTRAGSACYIAIPLDAVIHHQLDEHAHADGKGGVGEVVAVGVQRGIGVVGGLDADEEEQSAEVRALATEDADDSATVSVGQLLDQLPERYRQAVVLFYMEDKSYEQTAASLGLPLGTVKALLHRARKRLIELTREAA